MDTAIKTGIRAAAEIHLDKDWTTSTGFRYNKSERKARPANRRKDGSGELPIRQAGFDSVPENPKNVS
jgi:hypothetical protein